MRAARRLASQQKPNPSRQKHIIAIEVMVGGAMVSFFADSMNDNAIDIDDLRLLLEIIVEPS